MANWVAGLSAFRSRQYALAARYFSSVASNAHSGDLAAAGHFWAARAFIASGRPDLVSPRLRSAARHVDSFYRSEEHTSELQSLMRISYAVFCLKKKKNQHTLNTTDAIRHSQ